MRSTLLVDIESHSADLRFVLPPDVFTRLTGYRWKGRETVLTTNLEEVREQVRQARWIIGHNLHAFDLPAIFGHKSNEPLELAMEGRVYDTWTHAVLVNPAPYTYTNRHGKKALADKPDRMKSWFSLDEQAHQLGVPGKTHDLKALAKEFGDPELTGKARVRDGFGRIPLDDERYREYLRGDIDASEAVSRALLKLGPLDKYAMREQEIAARAAIITSNGFRVDVPRAQARVDELAARREVIMTSLVDRYGLPTEGLAPWDTNPGKAAILAALADQGITPDTVDWPKTPVWAKYEDHQLDMEEKQQAIRDRIAGWQAELVDPALTAGRRGIKERQVERAQSELEAAVLPPHFGLSFGGDELVALTAGTEAESLGTALAELKGQRSLAQLALDSVYPDGFAHPDISMLQRSGRWSTTEPGLTIWTARGPGAIEKAYFVPDTEDEVLLELDYSNADARAVAALSGDKAYAERFEPGADGHEINAVAAWGREVYDSDPKKYRQLAKPGGHGWGYRIGAKKLAATWGLPVAQAAKFLAKMSSAFGKVVAWQDRSVQFAVLHGYVTNPWGRRMPVERGREYTQAPALEGQSVTREIACDAILRMPILVLRRLKAFVHDALLFSVPKDRWEACRDDLVRRMETDFDPPGGQRIAFPVSSGKPGANWFEASHE